MTSEFDPDKWWTWPIPEDYILTRTGTKLRLSPEGYGWVEGFEAGRNSLAEEVLEWRLRVGIDQAHRGETKPAEDVLRELGL